MEIENGIEALVQAIRKNSIKKRTKAVNIADAQGMIAAREIYSPMMVPPFPKSAMDGYAVRACDVESASKEAPVVLKVLGELCAGDYAEYVYEPKTSVRVMTGAYVPEGFDAVIRQEDTDYGMDNVSIYQGVPAFRNYCKVGEDIRTGQCIVKAGTRLTPLHIGLLASVGWGTVEVVEPIRTAIISTGTELCTIGQTLAPGKIYNSIAYSLQAAIVKEGLEVVQVETCVDEVDLLCEKIKAATKIADIIITTGAVSVGKKDIIPEVTEKIGANVLFRGANIQPGTPTMASDYDGTMLLNLSGNPYAALANFEIYYWQMVAEMMGNNSYLPERKIAILNSEYKKVNKIRRFVRAYECDGKVAIPTDTHASSVISNMTECNCFIDLEAGRSVSIGDKVWIQRFK